MAIIQISKIQQRSGNLVDLPQLDEAEFGWATDAKRLFIGKTTPNENVEVLTSYSYITFSQIDGSVGNLNISALTAANGQPLVFDGTDWVNRGGDAGGLITLGDVSNVKLDGGSIGFVLQTDGAGNLSWTPKAAIVANIENVTKANPAVVTTVNNHYFVKGAQITITNAQGMTQLNGNAYYVSPLTSNTFSLYSDSGLTSGINSSAYTAYAYTTATATTTGTNQITVGSSSSFSANSAVQFIGNMTGTGITANTTYYVLGSPPDGTHIKIATSADSNTSNVVALQTASITANVYQTGGQAVAAAGATSFIGNAAGTNTAIQYCNATSQLGASSNFTFDYTNNILTVTGNANVSNLNSSGLVTATRLISNTSTGTAPLTVSSTTRVANLNVAYSNVSDYGNVTAQTTGTFYPVFVSGNSSANYQLGVNANISLNAATGTLTAQALSIVGNITAANILGNLANGNSSITIPAANGNINLNAGGSTAELVITNTGINVAGTLNATGNANVGNLGTAGLITATGNVTGGNLVTGGVLDATGNVSGANITATGNITAGNATITANISAGNVSATAGTFTGDVTASNANVTGQLVSTIATGTSPIVVTSTTRVANLNVDYSNVSDNSNVSSISSSTVYPVFVTGSSTANYALKANSAITYNVSTELLTLGNLTANANINASNITLGNAATIGSNLTVANNASIGGNITVTGNSNVTNNLNVTANANVIGNVTIQANLTSNTLNVGYTATIGTDLTVSGNSNISGNINLTGNLSTTSGNISANNLTLTNSAIIGGDSNVTGNSKVIGNSNVSGTLSVTGNANVGNIGAGAGVFTANISSLNANLGNLVQANYFQGDGGLLSNINTGPFSYITNGTSNVTVDNNSTVRIGVSGTANVIKIYGAGANITGYANISGNLTSGNIGATGTIIALGNISGANIQASGNIQGAGSLSVTGNLGAANISTGKLYASSDITGGGNIQLSGNATIQTNLLVTGSGLFGGNLSGNNLTLASNLSVGSNLTAVTGQFTNVTATTSNFLNLKDSYGATIVKIDDDGTMTANSPSYLSTQQAIVTYVQNAVAEAVGSSTPHGAVFYLAVQSAPTGYLVCDGTSYSRTTYPNLSAVIGNTYGGNVTNFNVPDLRGQFIRGWDNGRGLDPSRVFGSNQAANIGPHNHYYQDAWYVYDAENYVNPLRDAYGNPVPYDENDGPKNLNTWDADAGAYEFTQLSSTTGNVGIGGETRPTNVALLPVIYAGTPVPAVPPAPPEFPPPPPPEPTVAGIAAAISGPTLAGNPITWSVSASGYNSITINISGPGGFSYSDHVPPALPNQWANSGTATTSSVSGTYTMTIIRTYAPGYTSEAAAIIDQIVIP